MRTRQSLSVPGKLRGRMTARPPSLRGARRVPTSGVPPTSECLMFCLWSHGEGRLPRGAAGRRQDTTSGPGSLSGRPALGCGVAGTTSGQKAEEQEGCAPAGAPASDAGRQMQVVGVSPEAQASPPNQMFQAPLAREGRQHVMRQNQSTASAPGTKCAHSKAHVGRREVTVLEEGTFEGPEIRKGASL